MVRNAKIAGADVESLEIIKYPDPRLREVCTPVDAVDDSVRRLVERMQWLMLEAGGVGLAAPQVGVTVRIFVAAPSLDAEDLRAYVNPQIISSEGTQENEEGCLSLPGVFCKVKRSAAVTVRATGLDGLVFEETGQDLVARMYQHEIDHLNGTTLVDRMTTVARLANRRALKELKGTALL